MGRIQDRHLNHCIISLARDFLQGKKLLQGQSFGVIMYSPLLNGTTINNMVMIRDYSSDKFMSFLKGQDKLVSTQYLLSSFGSRGVTCCAKVLLVLCQGIRPYGVPRMPKFKPRSATCKASTLTCCTIIPAPYESFYYK